MTGPSSDPRPQADPGKNNPGNGPSGSEFMGVGLQFALSIIGGLYLGQWLDRRLNTAPWFLIIGVFLGAGLSFYSMYRKLMAAQAREDQERKARRDRL